ncbi:hypothetical protein ACODT3_04335 [Streptomyces sp. 4.24]|uniref:hypothetical protein n=1 Tax=Streptomyces tritrimontium TaxID=3406573 RepID=UPI003BB58C7D
MSGYEDTEEVGRTLRGWLAATAAEADTAGPGDPDGPGEAAGCTGLDVPPGDAETVTGAVRRLLGLPTARGGLSALLARSSVSAAGFAELRLLARALVVDEHPSAGRWTDTERLDVASWVALLLDRYGEDGVQWLVTALREEDRTANPVP